MKVIFPTPAAGYSLDNESAFRRMLAQELERLGLDVQLIRRTIDGEEGDVLSIYGSKRFEERILDFTTAVYDGAQIRTDARAKGGALVGTGFFNRKLGSGSGESVRLWLGRPANRFSTNTGYTMEQLLLTMPWLVGTHPIPKSRQKYVYEFHLAYNAIGAPTTDCGIVFCKWNGVLANVRPMKDTNTRTGSTGKGFSVSMSTAGVLELVASPADGTGGGTAYMTRTNLDVSGIPGLDLTKWFRLRFTFRPANTARSATMQIDIGDGTTEVTCGTWTFGVDLPVPFDMTAFDFQSSFLPWAGSLQNGCPELYVGESSWWTGPDDADL